MINLLPPDGKRRVVKEYWLRITALGFFMAGGVVFVLSILTLPPYFNVTFQLEAFSRQYDASEEMQLLEDIEKEFSTANAISDLLLDTPEYIAVETIMRALLDASGSGVAVQSVRLSKVEQVVEAIELGGVAVDRATLVAFRDAIENHEYFDTVDLPISNLAKDKDIPFTVTVTTSSVVQERL